MRIVLVSIFPEIYKSFVATSLIAKAQDKQILTFEYINPRDRCHDKHQQIDDEIYWWWAWLLMKAQPLIDAVNDCLVKYPDAHVIVPMPSTQLFTQYQAQSLSREHTLIFVSGRYEWIDQRFLDYFQDRIPDRLHRYSLGSFILLGWEVASMCMLESIVRLIPWVINDPASHADESYRIDDELTTLEYPQYTRPEEIYGYRVPDILLSGHHAQIQSWRVSQRKNLH